MRFVEYFAACTIALLVFLVPLPKAGMIQWSADLFIGISAVLFLIFLLARILAGKPWDGWWVAVWLVFTVICVLHYFEVFVPFYALKLSVLPVSGVAVEVSERFVDREEVLQAFIFFSCYWAIMYIVRCLPRNKVSIILYAVIAAAVFQSVYGLYALSINSSHILGIWEKLVPLSNVTGTFVNRNHLGGFLIICMTLTMGLVFTRNNSSSGSFELAKKSALVLFALLLVLAIVGSHSRANLVISFLAVLFYFLLITLKRNDSRSRRDRWVVIAIIFLTLLAAVWYGLDTVLVRFLRLSDGSIRLDVWRDSFDLPWEIWLWGIGPGQYQFIHKTVQQTHPFLEILYAHNDYLQLVLETGLVGALALALAGFGFLRASWPQNMSTLQIGALTAIVSIAVLSTVEFHLRIPGVALIFWVAVGVLTNSGLESRRERPSIREKEQRKSRLKQSSRNRLRQRLSN